MEGSQQRLLILILLYPMGWVKLIYIALFGLSSMLQMFALRYSLISQLLYLNANPFQMNSLTEAKLDLVIALVVSMGCWCGQKNLLKKECVKVGVDDGKFYCGWKGKFGLNLQAICYAQCQFTYISLQHPTSASDYLAFITSSLYGQFHLIFLIPIQCRHHPKHQSYILILCNDDVGSQFVGWFDFA